MQTTRRGVFAAGDVATGPSLIGKALASGMRAAQFVDEYLRTKTSYFFFATTIAWAVS